MAFIDSLIQIWDIVKFILIWFWWAIILVWIIYLKVKWKNWPLEAVIIEKRGDNLIKTNDRAGRNKDPYTGIIGYRLMKAKDTIPVVNFDGVLHNVAQHTTLFERFVNLIRGNAGTIFLFRYGSKQYKPVKVGQNGKLEWQEIKDDMGNPVFMSIYKPLDPRDKLGPLTFEVVDWDNMNQMVQEWQSTIERRKKAKAFWKEIVIPAIIIAATVIFCIIAIKYGYDYGTQLSKGGQPQVAPAGPAKAPIIPVISDVMPGT